MRAADTGRYQSVAPKLGHQPPLDGLRGLAILGVILAHGSYSIFANLAASVDIFFVVSGFLITTLLLEEDRKNRTVDMRKFYTRRALRLLPMLYLVVAGTVVGIWLAVQLHGADSMALIPEVTYGELWDMTKSDALAGSTYVYHVVHPVGMEHVVGGFPEIRPLVQLWSLSVEEHYYVVGVLVTIFAIRRRWVTQLMWLFLGIWVFIGLARLTGHVGPRLAWYQRPDSIMLGVVLALVNARLPHISPRFAKNLGRAATVAAAVFALTMFVGLGLAKPLGIHVPFNPPEGGSLSDGLYWGEFGFSVCAATVAVMILAMVRTPGHWLRPVVSWRPWQAVGVRSYVLYLVHVPLLIVLVNLVPSQPALAVLLYLPMLVIGTELCHRYVEKPMMRLRRKNNPMAETGTTEAVVDLRGGEEAAEAASDVGTGRPAGEA